MQQDPELVFHNVDRSDAVEQKIRERLERLERYADEIISARVVVDCPHRHKRTGNLYQVGIEVGLPGEDVHVHRNSDDDHSHEDVYVAIRDAFDAAERQLKRRTETRRGDSRRQRSGLTQGAVARLFPDEGYGFITPQAGNGHVYFHEHAIVDGDFEDLEVGTPVRYHEDEGEEGPQASTVHVLGEQETIPGTRQQL